MFAARDQENLIHGHQTAGAVKASNLGRQTAPKTPSANAPKTPFKVPLNDENNFGAFGAGKSVLKTVGKGNENLKTGGKKPAFNADAYKTPIGLSSLKLSNVADLFQAGRAPLGQKTTNAKTLALPTTTFGPRDNDLAKSRQKSASARKRGLRISHAEPVKIDVLSDSLALDDELDIGVTHPRPKDLDDFVGELPEIDLSILKGGISASDIAYDIYNTPGFDGLSMAEMRLRQDAEDRRVRQAIEEATCRRDVELSMSMLCRHEPECLWECKDEPARKEKVREECDAELKAIRASWQLIDKLKYWKEAHAQARQGAEAKPAPKPRTAAPRVPKSTMIPPKPLVVSTTKPLTSKTGPSATLARSAASKLAIQVPKPTTSAPTAPPKPSRYPASLSRKPSVPASAPAGYAARHASARAASNSTVGYAKGRGAGAAKRLTVLPKAEGGIFAGTGTGESRGVESVETEPTEDERALDAALLEDALRDFALPMPEE